MADISTAVPQAAPSGKLAADLSSPRPTGPLPLSLIRMAARLFEAAALAVPGFLIAWLYNDGERVISPLSFTAVPAVVIAALLLADIFGAYTLGALRVLLVGFPRVFLAWALALLGLLIAAFFLHLGSEFSRLWLGLWFMAGSVLLLGVRTGTSGLVSTLAKQGRLELHAVIVGGGESATRLIHALETSRSAGIRIVGLFDDRGLDRSAVVNYPTLGSFDDLVAFARSSRLDLLIIALPLSAEARLMQLLKKLWVLPVDIRISALSSRLRFRPRAYSYIGDVPFLDVFDKPLSPGDAIVKLLFDKLVGALALALLCPIMAAVALAVRLTSPGPVLFRQKRYGFNNELIEVYKFRSMYVERSDAGAVKLVTRNDPRVTPVGRFIRKTSLDELPQLFNVVFKGNLSLVGPRPHAVHAKAADALYQDVVDGYYARHKMKPGITGWAQINGWRGETDTPEKIQRRVECDLHYIENWSILFDAYILMMTPLSLLTKSEAAY